MALHQNSFELLDELVAQPSPVSGRDRRRRRRRAKLEQSPGGSDRQGQQEGAAGDDDSDTDCHSTGSGPAALDTQLQASPGKERQLQCSDGRLEQQASMPEVSYTSAPAKSSLRPVRSRSDVGSRSLGEPHHSSSATALESIHEVQPPPQPPQPSQQQQQQQQPLRPPRPTVTEALFQPFSDYLQAELHPGPSYPTADVVWGQTERDRVYNAILAVPYQLERFLWFGMLVCLDSFLAIFTLLPVRFTYALFNAARDCLMARGSEGLTADGQQAPHLPQQPGTPTQASKHAPAGKLQQRLRPASAGSVQGSVHGSVHGSDASGAAPPSPSLGGWQSSSGGGGGSSAGGRPGTDSGGNSGSGHGASGRLRLRGDQLYDLLCVLIFLGTVLFLWRLNAGALYFWMKDLTHEFLKLSVLFTALELSDKICCNFGVDVLEALAASCTQFMAARSWVSREAANLASDVLVATVLVMVHGAALMSQAMVFGVAMNSKKNALVALLIAANFTEIKGTVLKRFDSSKLYVLACQDVVERFHLLITLSFVLVEEMGSSGHTTPNRAILVQCCQIFMSEAVIDIIKHAVLGKFNEIRPGVYREFMKDLCERVSGAQSHNIHKLVGFEPFAPTALAFRIAVTYLALCHDSYSHATSRQVLQAAVVTAGCWAALFAAKLLLGYLLKQASASYVRHYEKRRGAYKGVVSRRSTMAGLPSFPATPALAKKEE